MKFSTVQNVHLDATEHGDKLFFCTLFNGACQSKLWYTSRSTSGVPRSVIQRAKQNYSMENEGLSASGTTFAYSRAADLFAEAEQVHPVIFTVQEINPDQLTQKKHWSCVSIKAEAV